jgi:hypothetical protein
MRSASFLLVIVNDNNKEKGVKKQQQKLTNMNTMYCTKWKDLQMGSPKTTPTWERKHPFRPPAPSEYSKKSDNNFWRKNSKVTVSKRYDTCPNLC